MSNMILYIVFIFFSLLPAIYLAKQKNFIFINSEKNNVFLIRFIFLLPGVLAIEFFSFLIGFLFLLFAGLILLSIFSFDLFNSSVWILVGSLSIPISFSIIYISKKFVLRADPPFENQYNLDEYDLYMLMPSKREIEDSLSYQVTGKIGSARIGMQVKEISVNFSKMKGDIIFTERGELIVSTRALSVFQSNCLTGYTTKYVIDKKSKQKSDSYFQLVADELMPLSSKTEFKKWFFGSIFIVEDRAYYDNIVLKKATDFNRTAEYLGDNSGFPYYHQRLWIVTRKVRNIFISDFNRNEKEFIPVHLINNELNKES